MKVSFILPVYKVEAYLRQCVESITCQTYREIEIILVDDGSPDGSPALCDQLATEDERILVVHKSNGGLSDARNAGLGVATGDYVVFVDSDDFWVGNESLKRMVDVAKANADCDFVGYNCNYYYPASDRYTKWVEYSADILTPVTGDKAMQLLVASGTFPMSACMKLMKRSVLIDNNITFKKGQIAEDIPWFINLLDKTNKCMFVNDYIYAYRQNVTGSISSSGGERSFNSLLDIVKTELEKIEGRSFSEDAKNSLRSFLAYEVSILIMGVCHLPKEKQAAARKELKSLCWLLKYTQNPKVGMVSKVYNLCGYAITESVLRLYNKYRVSKS